MTAYRSVGRPADRYRNTLATPWEREYREIRYVPVLSDSLPEIDWATHADPANHAAKLDFSDLYSHQPYAWDAPTVTGAAKCDFVEYRWQNPDHFFADSSRFGAYTVSSK
jgi:CDP-4-dehydro-6-deoxyglucose reductase